MTSKLYWTTSALAVALGIALFATRPDPANMRMEYKPGAYLPKQYNFNGEVRLLSAPVVEAAKRTRVRIEYTVGDTPIETGQGIGIWKHFTSDVEEFQVDQPNEPAYFAVETTAAGVEFEKLKFSNAVTRNTPSVFPYFKCVQAAVRQGRLEKGDKVIFDLGGSKGVRMQSYEENLFNFRVAIVDTEKGSAVSYAGDAIMKVIGGRAEKLRVVAPAIAALGEGFSVAVMPQDRFGSLARDHRNLKLQFVSENVGGSEFDYDPELLHYVAQNVLFNNEGVVRIEVRTTDGRLRGVSNPVRVERDPVYRVFYGDLHQHTYLADGRGIFEELYLYARRKGLLDFGALSPHQGPLGITGPLIRLQDVSFPKDYWPEMVKANKTLNGWKGFVTILGYEYSVGTKVGGHHNVYYEGDYAPTTMQLSPDEWRAPVARMLELLRRTKSRALVIPHIGGGPPDWKHKTDPRAERLFEIASIHGVFEESWQKHLEAGQRVAASASGDTHTTSFGNANPGLHYIMTNPLTGVYALSKTRKDIWSAMYQKRTFAMTGNNRMLVDFEVNGERMGGELPQANNLTARIRARVSGTEPIFRVDLLKNSKVIHSDSPSRGHQDLIRVKWGDNLYQRRAMPGMSPGELSADGGRVKLVRGMQLDNSFEHFEQSGDKVTWTVAATSNDRDPFVADISEATGDSLHFQLNDEHSFGEISVTIPLDQLRRDGHFAWRKARPDLKSGFNRSYLDLMGIEPAFTLECELVSKQGPLDYELNYEDRTPTKSGDYYYLRVEQLDSNLAWSSPVWIN